MATAVTHLRLTPELLRDIDAAVAAGGYTGRAEYIRAAIRSHLADKAAR